MNLEKDELIKSLSSELQTVKNSFSYRLGFFLTAPIRIIIDSIKSLNMPSNKLWLYKQLLIVFIKNPWKTLRKINLHNIVKLNRALKVENPIQIFNNSARFIISPEKNANNQLTDFVTNDENKSEKTYNNDKINSPLKHDESALKEYFVNGFAAVSNKPLLLATQILSIIESRCEKIVIAFSHDNYLETTAGVQIYMNNERDAFSLRSVSYLQIHPQTPVALFALIDDIVLNVCLDKELICTVTAKEFIRLGGMLAQRNSLECIGVIIHHLLNWSIQVVDQFLEKLNNEKIFFWLHDYYICCPQVTLLRNDYEFCHKPDLESNSCMICLYGDIRRSNAKHFRLFLNNYRFTFLTPSKVVRSIIVSDYPELKDKIIISPLLNLIKQKNRRDNVLKDLHDPLYKLKIAYLGVPKRYKGWETWRLFVDSSVSDSYKCVYLSTEEESVPEEHIYINTLYKSQNSVISLLIMHKIDIVILWSIVPETFSFTLYEAIAAGCFILTNPLSGNIAAYVRENSCGIVFESENDLISLLKEPSHLKNILINFHQNNISYSDLKPNIHTAALLFNEQMTP